MGFQFQSVGAVSPLLTERLHIGYAELGFLVGLFSLPGVVLALPGGLLGERFGDRRVVLAGLGLMSLGSAVIGMSTVFPVAVAGRLLTAVGAVLLNVLLAKMVADWFTAREVVWAMSIAINAWPVGIGLALFVLPAIASAWGLAAVFYAAALAAALACAAVAAVYQPPPPAAASGGGVAHVALTRGEIGLVSMAAVPWMLYNVGYAVMLSFVPVLLVNAGFSMERAGALLGFNTLLFIASVQAGGAAAQWLARAEIVVAVGSLVLAGALVSLPYAPSLAMLMIAGLLGGLPAGALVSAPTAVLGPATRARGMGVFYTWYYAGMALLPPVAGWLQDTFGRTAAIHFAATAVFLALPFYLLFVARLRWTASPSRMESAA